MNNSLRFFEGKKLFFNESKGCGFVTEEGSVTDYLMHISGLINEEREGDVVKYELKEDKKGLNAVSVKAI
ncbi:MAG: cold-shock protein [Flavobacteriaceae bacterium]|nr:MAG: cold-shock protein [Flavobacteriaceae bacterium]